MKLVIEIVCDNAAFEPTPEDEVMRILRRLCYRTSEYGVAMSHGRLLDVNGNAVGKVEVER